MKIWPMISAFLAGALLVAIIFAKWIAGDDYSMEVAKIKNKRTSGTTTTTIPMQMNVSKKKEKLTKEQKKLNREKRKKLKKDQRKAKKNG